MEKNIDKYFKERILSARHCLMSAFELQDSRRIQRAAEELVKFCEQKALVEKALKNEV